MHLETIRSRVFRRVLGVLRSARARAQDDPQHLMKQAGQVLALFAIMITVIVGLAGLAIDVSFAWREELRIQRAADAAALAGVVYLPGNVSGGLTAATNEANKNGFVGSGTTSISPSQAAGNPREMDVKITTQVPTFFSRIFSVNYFTVSRTGKAVYILPVPMGSPENYYGTYGPYTMRKYDNSADTTATLSGPASEPLNARGFWGSVLTQGANVDDGDAYMPKKNYGGSGTNPIRDTVNYYDYAVTMPPGSSNGKVWIYDPAFCATFTGTDSWNSPTKGKSYGTGDRWLGSIQPVSTFFNLYDTNGQPYTLAAHTPLGGSGSLFTGMKGVDSLGYPSTSARPTPTTSWQECRAVSTTNTPITYSDYRQWHNKWWPMTQALGVSLQGGHTYRIRVTTDPGNTSQDATNANNDFAIFASASGGSPQVYGIGAMQAFSPLPQNGSTEFYLAQIDAQSGAGKTMRVSLYDPGDTNGLTANLQILQPTGSGWTTVPSMTWTTTKISTAAGSCPSGSGTSIQTATTTQKIYNGCWLQIDIPIPATYSAPQSGWWKIRYTMGSDITKVATDETTWQVDLRGNPVHLIP